LMWAGLSPIRAVEAVREYRKFPDLTLLCIKTFMAWRGLLW